MGTNAIVINPNFTRKLERKLIKVTKERDNILKAVSHVIEDGECYCLYKDEGGNSESCSYCHLVWVINKYKKGVKWVKK